MLAALGVVSTPGGAFAQALDSERFAVQKRFEEDIGQILRSQLNLGEFLVSVDVTLEDKPQTAATATKSTTLPYSAITVSPEQLQSMLESGAEPSTRPVKSLAISLVFDRRIPEAKQKLIGEVLKTKFGIDGAARSLTLSTAELVTSPVLEQIRNQVGATDQTTPTEKEKLTLESERMKTELVKKDLEREREKFELEKRLKNAEDQTKQAQTKADQENKARQDAETKAKVEVEAAKAEAAKPNAETGLIDKLSKIQFLLLAVILGLFMFLGFFLSAGAVRKGMVALSEGVAGIGTGLKESRQGATGEGEAQRPAKTEETAGASEASATVPRAGAGAVPAAFVDEEERRRVESYLVQLQDKIEVLAKDNNFAMYGELIDLIDKDQSLPLAASLLLSLGQDSTRELVKGLSPGHIERLRKHLGRAGALQEAKQLRAAALQEFYGRIAIEEFSGSPIMLLNDTAWLTSMNNAQLAAFIAGLDPETQPAFLACLTPSRVQRLIESSADAEQRRAILQATLAVGKVTSKEIEALVLKLQAQKGAAAKDQGLGGVVDAGRYLGTLVSGLGDEDRKILLERVKGQGEVEKTLRQYYVSFDATAKLPKEMLQEIFGDRPNAQIAMILFAAAEAVRQAVLAALPDIKAATVRDELKLLESKPFYKKRNDKASVALQKEIGVFLLKLRQEGLLADDGAEETSSTVGGAA